jgi:hypothetical protein
MAQNSKHIFVMAAGFMILSLATAQVGSPEETVESENLNHVFTYSLIETEKDRETVLNRVRAEVIPGMVKAGATVYAIWIPPEQVPEHRGIKGLQPHEVILMLAWPKNTDKVESLDTALKSIEGVKQVTTRTFDPIYLVDKRNVPTGTGFYVHRPDRYLPKNLDRVVLLSKQAWKTFDPKWGTKVIGLFRERPENEAEARLLRIVWYPSPERWLETRNFDQEPNSEKIFGERETLSLKRGRRATITDRFVLKDMNKSAKE